MCYRLLLSIAFVVVLLVAACGGGETASSPAPTSPSPASPPVVQDSAPRELQGTWLARDPSNLLVTLTLTETTYRIARGMDGALGAIDVRGDQIDFWRSNACIGTGSYRWSLTGNSLRFTSTGGAGADPCPWRSEVLDGYTYTKSS